MSCAAQLRAAHSKLNFLASVSNQANNLAIEQEPHCSCQLTGINTSTLGRGMVHFEQHFTAAGNVVVSDVFGALNILYDAFHRIGGCSDFPEVIASNFDIDRRPCWRPSEISGN